MSEEHLYQSKLRLPLSLAKSNLEKSTDQLPSPTPTNIWYPAGARRTSRSVSIPEQMRRAIDNLRVPDSQAQTY